jgi:2-C-methyl-D-erythritol 2,4-cyclodiphosphate synthase
MRIGIGIDIHRFTEGDHLCLGGIKIPHNRAFEGHSDADVLLHSIIDALLGAMAWGDIGSWFPDTEAKYKGIDSKLMFSEVWQKVKQEGYELVNCDSSILLEKPKLRPHIDAIRTSIAELFSADVSQIGVKAGTTEKLGYVGREEGAQCHSVVLLKKSSQG